METPQRSDVEDSILLHDLVLALEKEDGESVQVGGVGIYARTAHHGPFLRPCRRPRQPSPGG